MNETLLANFLNTRNLHSFHKILLGISVMIIIFSGYSLSIIGAIIPIVSKEWNISEALLGVISSSAMFGMMFGSIFLSFLADKIGAKKILIFSILLISVSQLVATMFTNPIIFTICRFMAGIGSGGATPIVISLLTEFTPKTSKSKMVAIALTGNQIAGILASLFGILLIEQFGWRSVLWIAVVPLIFIPYIWKVFPESAQFLARAGKDDELGDVLSKIDGDYKAKINLKQALDTIDGIEQKAFKKVSYSRLFTKKYFLSTVLISLIYICGLLAINGINTWLPNVMVKNGFELGSSLAFSMLLNVGTMIGTITWATATDKFGYKKILPMIYIVGGILMMLMGIKISVIVLYVFITLIGIFLFSAHSLVNAFVSQYYPDDIRTTGVGFANGLGRIGGMLGPILGGVLLSANASVPVWFISFGLPGIIAGISIFIVSQQSK